MQRAFDGSPHGTLTISRRKTSPNWSIVFRPDNHKVCYKTMPRLPSKLEHHIPWWPPLTNYRSEWGLENTGFNLCVYHRAMTVKTVYTLGSSYCFKSTAFSNILIGANYIACRCGSEVVCGPSEPMVVASNLGPG